MSALLVPVLRVPSSLLVPVVCLVFFLFTAHVQQIGPTVQYCRYVHKKRRPPRTTVEIPFKIKDDAGGFSPKDA